MPISEYIRNLREKVGHDLLMMPCVSAIIFNNAGDVLLQLSRDTGEWATIGGAIEPGETLSEAVVREVWEEAGLTVEPVRIIGVYSGKDLLVRYPNGDHVGVVTVLFLCRVVSGTPHVNDDESLEIRFFPVNNLPEMEERFTRRVRHAVENRETVYFD